MTVVVTPVPGIGTEDYWNNIKTYVQNELTEEGRDIDDDSELILIMLANECVNILSSKAEMNKVTLVGGTDIVFTSGVGLLPKYFNVVTVLYDGVPIPIVKSVDMDNIDPLWRTDTSAEYPTYCMIDNRNISFPGCSGFTDSLVVVECYQKVPQFVYGEAGADVGEFIPDGYELLPAYYILSSYKWDKDHGAEVARFQRNSAMVKDMMPQAIEAVKIRSMLDYSY